MSLDASVEFGVSVLEDIIKAGYNFLKKEHQKKDFFQVETRKYVRGMMDRYGKVKVLTQREPTDLMRLYVRANIIEKITARVGGKVRDLEEFFDLEKRSFYKKLETKDGEEIANKLQRFIVLGKPGAGKTTFLRYIALAMLHKQSVIKKRRLPIFVTLRDWADKKMALIDYLAEEFDTCGFAEAKLFVENTLKQGICLVLFDGLDEISQDSSLDDVIRKIRDFTDKYGNNQFIISCRVAAYNHWFEKFTDVEMADFNDQQIKTFVQNWFIEETKIGKDCLEHLKGSTQLKELAKIPLLLTLMCITFEEDNNFPKSRADLYERAIDALLTKWDSSRRIRRKDPYEQLSIRYKKNMFSQIGFETFLNDQYFIRERDLTKMIEAFIINMPDFEQQKLSAESKDVLKSIEAQHGIFVERARHIYSFGHLTFQEYFTAKYISDFTEESFHENVLKKFLYDHKWKEVSLLTVSMLPKADKILLKLLKRNQSLLKYKPLNFLLKINQEALLPTEISFPGSTREAKTLHLLLSLAISETRFIIQQEFLQRAKKLYKNNGEEIKNVILSEMKSVLRNNDEYSKIALILVNSLNQEKKEKLNQNFGPENILSIGTGIDLDELSTMLPDASIAEDIFQNLIFPDEKQDDIDEFIEEFTEKIRQNTLYQALKLIQDLSLKKKQIPTIVRKIAQILAKEKMENLNTIENFLRGNIMIAHCLKTDCYVSNKIRQEVSQRLLEPLTED